MLCIEGLSLKVLVSIEDSVLEQNSGIIGELKFFRLEAKRLKLSNNSSVVSLTYVDATFSDLEAFDNVSLASTSMASILRESKFRCSNCLFYRNFGEAGVVIIDNSSKFELDKCSFKDNYSTKGASAITITRTQAKNVIRNTLFQNNRSDRSDCVALDQSSLVMTNMAFISNSAKGQTPGVKVMSSSLEVEQSLFSDQYGEESAFFIISSKSKAVVSRSVFTRGRAILGGVIALASNSEVKLDGCSISDISQAKEGKSASSMIP